MEMSYGDKEPRWYGEAQMSTEVVRGQKPKILENWYFKKGAMDTFNSWYMCLLHDNNLIVFNGDQKSFEVKRGKNYENLVCQCEEFNTHQLEDSCWFTRDYIVKKP